MSENIIKLEGESTETPQTEFGILMDSTDEDFRQHCRASSLGYVRSLRNYISGAYQMLVQMKDELVVKIEENKLTEDSEETKTVKGIYLNLIKLEQKATICVEVEKEKELKD